MASTKRKEPPGPRTASSTKKRRTSEPSKSDLTSAPSKPQTASQNPSVFIAKEQPAFPRGGGGSLRPGEHKANALKASNGAPTERTRDNDLFGPRSDDPGSLDNSDIDMDEAESRNTFVKKKKSSKIAKSTQSKSPAETVPIEALSFKRLMEGTLLLGFISAIGVKDLAIALPNNLSGFVGLTEISDQFTAKIEHSLQHLEIDDAEAEEESDNFDLQTHFQVGQPLRVAVVSLSGEQSKTSRSKKRVGLTVHPKHTNHGLTRTSLAIGCTLQVAVVSKEDHGLVVDTGMDDLTGFIPNTAFRHDLNISDVQPGSVFLCKVTSIGANGKSLKLSTDLSQDVPVKNAPSIESFLPGTLVEVLLTEVTDTGVAGKVMGLLDVTADVLHSGLYDNNVAASERFQTGSRVKGRLICTFARSDSNRLGFSVLPDLIRLEKGAQPQLKLSSIVPTATIMAVIPGLGAYFSLGQGNIGFAHISRLSDKAVDVLSETSGPFKVSSTHRARILDYNAIDGVYLLSLQRTVLEQPFLRIDDISIGEVVKTKIEKVLVGEKGVNGLILSLSPGISGLVPVLHMSDVTLLHPEKKFKEGSDITARVLSINKSKRQVRLTLKKSLVNSDQRIWTDLRTISPDDSALGTIIKVDPHGALIQFFGLIKGYLPVSEMSEAYIRDATEHFKIGQVLTVYALNISPDQNRLVVTAREPSATQDVDLSALQPGSLVSGIVFEKSQSDILMRVQGAGVIARLPIDHVSDGSEKKRRSALDKIRVGQKLENVLILNIQRKGRLIEISNRQTIIKAAQKGDLLTSFENLKEGGIFTGFISNITDAGVFVRFASNITGLISKSNLPPGAEELNDYGMVKFQSITAKVLAVDYRGATPRFWLTMKEEEPLHTPDKIFQPQQTQEMVELVDPVDHSLKAFSELVVGKIIKARITSVKETQINIELAKGIQGRIDVSEIFDTWEDIKDRKHPLKQFNPKQVLSARIIGAHDTRNHKFLPLSHRSSKHTVFELSARSSLINGETVKNLRLSDLQTGSSHIVFVNNVAHDHLMVNVTPEIRGRIRATDVSNDLSLAANLKHNFPVGSALRAKVVHVDVEKKHLDLSARTGDSSKNLTLDDVSPGDLLPGRITRVSNRNLLVQLSTDLVGSVELLDIADDYSEADTSKHEKNAVVRVCVTEIDKPNKKVYLSTRPSKILSSSMKVRDPEIGSVNQLKINDVRRGFVTNVSEKGIFVALGREVTAFVRVTNLSDDYIKEWRDHFQRDQLVEGKIIALDKTSGHVQLSLRKSHILGNYVPPVTFNDMHEGDIVTGKIAKVEPFGVFLVVDNSENVRGLCHRSEIAEKRIEDVTTLGLNEGDAVKVKVLKVEPEKRRINFGMKASYFADLDSESTTGSANSGNNSGDDMSEASEGDMELDFDDADMSSPDSDAKQSFSSDEVMDDVELDEENSAPNGQPSQPPTQGLVTSGFDWLGTAANPSSNAASSKFLSDQKPEVADLPKKKKRKAEIQVDKTGDLDINGPKSVDDFERLLLGQPESAELWVRYIAFHIDLGDIDQARQVGERALKSIGPSQETEKMTIWIALLNLENTFGDEESLDAIFQRACEYNDPRETHEKLASIYIRSGKHRKADEIFQAATKKFTQSMDLWINYATFLFDVKEEPQRARTLLPRALQALPKFMHFDITSSFARLEFKTKTGVPEEGRTRFQGLINLYPKRLDLFNVMLDMELHHGDEDQIRQLFEQVFNKKMKPGTAKKFFNRWLKFEKEKGDQRRIEDVEAKAANWVMEYKESRSV